jgi:4-amino-4-deoxy-L-arabinose transferase-like glycosyltransferase
LRQKSVGFGRVTAIDPPPRLRYQGAKLGVGVMTKTFWAILGGVALVMLAMLALRPLLPIDETRYLSVAWEMHLSGDPVHLTKNGEMYTHKTPLLFVLINLVWLIIGVSEFAARLVGPACALGMIAGTGALARRLWPQAEGRDLRAMAVLAGFSVFLVYGSTTMFDALLGLGVLGGVAALWQIGQGDHRPRLWLAFGLALAFGIYAKGPVIFVHLMPLLLTMPLWATRPPRLTAAAKGFGLAFLAALALVALWIVPTIATAPPAFVKELLWTQSAARVAGGLAHDRPIWFLAALLPLILFPWGWSLGFWRGLGQGWRSDPAQRLCMIWAAATLVLFSLISGKQVHYLIPAFPAVALLIAAQPLRRGFGWLALFVLAGLAILAGLGLLPMSGDLAKLTPLWPLTAFGAALALLAVLQLSSKPLAGNLAAGVGLALALHGLVALTSLHDTYDGHTLALRLAEAAPQGLAVTNAEYNAEVNFLGRLTAPVALTPDAETLRNWAQTHPQGTVFGRIKESPLKAAPAETFDYMGQAWGLWPASAISRE